MEAEYQAEHTRFVSGHNGSDPMEILLVGAPVHCSQLLLIGLGQLLGLDYSSIPGSVLEWAVLVVPTLLSLTAWAPATPQVAATLFTLALVTILMAATRTRAGASLTLGVRSSFVTNHRALMIVFTTVGILAVDFPVFPRKFAKTETFGYGWMDLGVGSFAFVNGLVSPEARKVQHSLKKNLSGCTPLVVLGLIRLVCVTCLGYHENVTEYGSHWNFFFTLASVRLLSSLVQVLVTSTKAVWVTSVAVAVMYEGLLTFYLADWILDTDTPRDNIVNSNREGLFSALGYLSIYLAGVSWGRDVFELNKTVSELMVMLRLLLLWTAVMWLSLGYSLTFFMPPSRRLANYAFFTWILAYNLTILSFFLITDLIVIHLQSKTKSKMKGSRTKSSKDSVKAPETSTMYRCPNFVKAVDHNPLFFFLLANLLTGLINITVETINTEDNTAVLIILIYQAVLAIVVTCLYRCNIKLKCW